ncbi:phosphotransferase family protein [Halomicroarcula sp. GCM10025709]
MSQQGLAPQWDQLERPERRRALEQIGAALATVNDRQFDRHGHIVAGDADGLVLDTGAWSDVLVDRIEMTREIASANRFEQYFDAVIDVVEAHSERLDRAPAVLVHGDPAMPNIFRSRAAIGFVDWELAHVGDPARELHRARDQLLESRGIDDERLVSALHDGYRRRSGSLPPGLDDRREIYDAVRYLGTVGFVDKIAASTDEPTDELAASIEAEMNNRLDAVRH